MDAFFSSLNLQSLSEDQKSTLDAHISRKEVLGDIKGLKSGKVPGPDGLSSEVYKALQNILADPLLNMFIDSFKKGSLPMSVREANKKQPEASYKPISLLSGSETSLLLMRTKLIFIKGHNSHNNMHRLLNTIQFFSTAVNKWFGSSSGC